MNEFSIKDIKIGMKQSFLHIINSDMMDKFYDITGDMNPLHTDESFAEKRGYNGRVVYGMLTAAMISTLGGCYIPGKYCLIQGVEVRFVKPVYIGDELNIMGEVTKVDHDLNYVEIKVTMCNQRNEKVLRGVLKAGVLNG